MRAAITQDFMRELPHGPCDVWDTKLTGLVLRVRESGHASWVFTYGRSKKVTLGRADAIPPAKARLLAEQVIGDLAHGKDPAVERRKKRASSLRVFVEQQYRSWAEAHRKTGEETVERVLAVFDDGILSRRMSELSPFLLEQWRTRRRKAGIRDSTINRDLDALRTVLSKAVEWRLITEHPMREVKRTRIDIRGRLRYLSPEEEKRLRAALVERDEARHDGRRRFNAWRAARGYKTLPPYEGYPDHLSPIVLLALNTGLRRGELLGLRWADLDLTAARLTVRGLTAKSGITRYVPLNTEAVTVLQKWQKGRKVEGDVLVFPGPTGEPMTTLKTAWQPVGKAARLKDFTFHDLRHTFASKLVQAGVDLNTVRELLGHADIKMTLRYAHLAPEHKAAAVAKLVSA